MSIGSAQPDGTGPPPSPLNGIYLIRHPAFNAAFRILDWCLSILVGSSTSRRKPRGLPARPRILVANGAHLGDVVLSTAVLPALKEMFPGCSIGFMTGSWSRMVVAHHPLIDRVHWVDHWRLSRSNGTTWQRMRHYWRTRSEALREIRQARYDAAIDLYFYFPNSIPLLWQSGIPVRVGYSSAGFGPLLTAAVKWANEPWSMTTYHLRLLAELPGALPPGLLKPVLPSTTAPPRPISSGQPYVVLHMGTSATMKEWSVEKWRSVAQKLADEGRFLVFTGAGKRETALAAEVAQGLPRCANLCDAVDWKGFLAVIRFADIVIGVDSIAGHVAAAYDVPVVTISSGINNPAIWRPVSTHSTVLTAPTPCAPCYRAKGCESMQCIADTTVEDVINGYRKTLLAMRGESRLMT